MKKLLLVLLVPFLVLGVMGCGSGFETGSETPLGLQGAWVGSTDATVVFVLTASQATVKDTSNERTINYATEFGGGGNSDNGFPDAEFTITFLDYVTGEEVGSIKATFDDSTPAIQVSERTIARNYQDYFIPTVQDYQ